MELALIPVAAILLLLSGAGLPARAQPQTLSAAALMRELLVGTPGSTSPTPAAVQAKRREPQAFRAPLPLSLLAVDAPVGTAAFLLPGLTRGSTRKLFRTRFGFAEGAYLAVGPPFVGFRAELG